jgi:hypothetical protein
MDKLKISDMLSKFIPLLFVCCAGCRQKDVVPMPANPIRVAFLNPYARVSDIPLPAGFYRINYNFGSFGDWLGRVGLKKNKTVYRFDGSMKKNQAAQFAVLNIPVGNRDLQQCADAVMRLRAEYLYEKKEFEQIAFTDNANTTYRFTSPYSRQHFDNYLQQVFGMCGSASLNRQLTRHVEINDISAGDVLIRGGFPGHAVIVMDVAKNDEGKNIYLLAQSYMPAQDIHILINPLNKYLSPWYEVNDETLIQTPEYTFSRYELKRW